MSNRREDFVSAHFRCSLETLRRAPDDAALRATVLAIADHAVCGLVDRDLFKAQNSTIAMDRPAELRSPEPPFRAMAGCKLS